MTHNQTRSRGHGDLRVPNVHGDQGPHDANEAVQSNHTMNSIRADSRSHATLPHNRWVVLGLKIVSVVLVTFYFIIPAIIRLNPWIMNEVTFLSRFHWPPFITLTRPEEFGLNGTRNLQIIVDSEVTLGAWHVLPDDVYRPGTPLTDEQFDRALKTRNFPVLLYLHGNAGTRGGWHRVQLYKFLASIGFHVFAVDYRGFGDSTGYPTENSVCADALYAYYWLRDLVPDREIYIWGHSLGSGIATKVAKQISQRDSSLTGLILEAPFNNIIEAALHHPFSRVFTFMPWFTWAFIEGLTNSDIHFASDENIAFVTAPTLILHAKDDGIIPFDLGRKLYEAAVIRKKVGGVKFISFEAEHQYGHKYIHKAPEMTSILKDFMAGKL